MSASAYSTHPGRFAFGCGTIPAAGGGGPPVNFGGVLASSGGLSVRRGMSERCADKAKDATFESLS
jgi:hypothetical protein